MTPRSSNNLLAVAWLPVSSRSFDHIPARSDEFVADTLTKVPHCALPCLMSVLSDASCASIACACSNTTLADDTTACVLAACTIPDALVTKNLTETVCDHPRRDRSSRYGAMSTTMGTITAVLVVIRTIFQRFFSHKHGLDANDWIIVLSLVVGIPCTALNTQGLTKYGLGKDVWTLEPSMLTSFAMYFYILEIIYIILVALVKLSLSLFCLSIFTGANIRQLLWGTAIFNILFGISFAVTAIFQCTPVHYFWTRYNEPSAGKCIDANTVAWVHGAVNVAADVWMIAIPLTQLGQLKLHWKKKIGASIMFLTGAFATVVSVLRLQSLIYFANSINPTWDQWTVAWWSTIEINIGLVCTCLPTIRLILAYLFPSIFSTSMDLSHVYYRAGPCAKLTCSMVVPKKVPVAAATVDGSRCCETYP